MGLIDTKTPANNLLWLNILGLVVLVYTTGDGRKINKSALVIVLIAGYIFCSYIDELFKYLIAYPRPGGGILSTPSGHAQMIAFCTVVLVYLYEYIPTSIFLVFLCIFIGLNIQNVYVSILHGYHTYAQLLLGCIIGILVGICVFAGAGSYLSANLSRL